MTLQEAMDILKVSEPTEDALLKAYRQYAKAHHPDLHTEEHKKDQEELMKLGNLAFEFLIKNKSLWVGKQEFTDSKPEQSIDEELQDVLQKIRTYKGITREIRGVYLWVYGNTYPYKTQLKEAGFKWASKKKEWFYAPNDRQPRRKKTGMEYRTYSKCLWLCVCRRGTRQGTILTGETRAA